MERAIPNDAAQASGVSLQALTRQMVRMAVSACHAFLDWERGEMMRAEPTPQTQAQHRRTLLRLLRLMRRLHAEATEPEYPDRTAAAEVEAVLWKLNQSWETFYNPMPEAEAEKILRDCFPGYGSGIKTRSRLRD